jgi:enoyl-CoA hydratase/carnithine racemase
MVLIAMPASAVRTCAFRPTEGVRDGRERKRAQVPPPVGDRRRSGGRGLAVDVPVLHALPARRADRDPAAEYFLPENTIGLTISNAASVLLPRLVGHRATRLVLESARIGAADALALGLLDEIVEEAGLVETAIGIVHRWTPPGGATAAHLTLLRPPMAEIERAMAAETEATRATEADGLSRAGINRFLSGRADPP